jgi:transcription initiation factor TFIIIB Brf1 subunit/transcription initiation factor TFIIB
MAAVLRAVVDDCRGGTDYRRAVGAGTIDARDVRAAIAYVASRDRSWPFSFENLCDALGVDASGLRQELAVATGSD